MTREQQELVCQYIPLTYRCLNMFSKLVGRFKDKDDAHAAAEVGLVFAARHYKPDYMVNGKPVKFITYASNCIRNQMIKELDQQDRYISRNKQQAMIEKSQGKVIEFRHPDPKPVGWEIEDRDRVEWILNNVSPADRKSLEAYMASDNMMAAGELKGVTRESIRQAIVSAQLKFSGKRHKVRYTRRDFNGAFRPEQRGAEAASGKDAGAVVGQVAGRAADDSGGGDRRAA